MAKTVEIFIYDGMNELDFAIVYEILSAVEVSNPAGHTRQKAFAVDAVAERNLPVETSHLLKVLPHKVISASMGANILIVPGGPGARRPGIASSVISWLTQSTESADLISSISTGVYILGKAGLINDRRVATHYTKTEDLQRLYPRAHLVIGQRVTTDGRNLMTSAGGSAAVDLALAITSRFCGPQAAEVAANRIEWEHFS